jgi:MIP family channel proteins
MTTTALFRRLTAEVLGTFWLVLGGCGSAVLAAAFPQHGIGFAGVALAFGLTVLTGAYAFGPISGGHFNPAVTVGLWVARRIPSRDVLPYIVAQVVGAIVAAAVLYVIASGATGFSTAGGFASNGYGDHSPGGYSLTACIVCELVLTFMFLMVILGATDERAPGGFDRARAHADPPDQHPGHQHVGEPGAQHGAGAVRRRLGNRAALGVLGRSARGRRGGGYPLSAALRAEPARS